MKLLKRFLIFFCAVALSNISYGQVYRWFAAGNENDTARTTSHMLVPGVVRLPFYGTSDTNKVLGLDASGRLILRTKGTGGSSSADSTVFATLYRVDTAKANLRATLVPQSRTITAGTGLSGGGDLSTNRTILLANTAVTPGSYTNTDITVDAQGRITAASNGSGTADSSDYQWTYDSYAFPDVNHDSRFMVHATAILRPAPDCDDSTNITWQILESSDGHGSSYITGARGILPANYLSVEFPRVRKVFDARIGPDEKYAGFMVQAGPSVSFVSADFNVVRPDAAGVKLTGNGSGGWAISPSGYITNSSYSTVDGITRYTVAPDQVSWPNYNHNITYEGTNGYRIQRVAPFGMHLDAFALVDDFGNPVTVNPTSSDIVYMSSIGMKGHTINCRAWDATSLFMCGLGINFWCELEVEVYVRAQAKSANKVLVIYQPNYDEVEPSTTNYKLYRNTTNDFGSATLIHTGSEGLYLDTGLLPGTLYYYFYVAVTGSGDEDVTYWPTKTFE